MSRTTFGLSCFFLGGAAFTYLASVLTGALEKPITAFLGWCLSRWER